MPSAYFSDSRYRLDFTVSVTEQQTANNRSRVRRRLVITKVGQASGWSSDTSSWSSGGSTGLPSQSGTFTYNFGNYSTLVLMDRQDWVTHNSNGTRVVNTSASVNADSPLGTANIWSFNTTLPTIPRQTTPNIEGGGGFTTGVESTINLPRHVNTYTHDVSWSIGSKSGTIATGAATSTTWTPDHSILTELPNAASGTVVITVVTKSGSTTIGTRNTNFTLTANPSVVPTITGVVWSDANTLVATNIGGFIQNYSLISGAIGATAPNGATITSKQVIIGGVTYPEAATFSVSTPGTVNAEVRVTDSRGRTTTSTASFTVLAYTPPRLGSNGWGVHRANASNVKDDNGAYLRLDLHAIASSLTVGGTQKNALKLSVRTRPTNGAWTNRNNTTLSLTQNGAIQITGGATFLTTQAYIVEVTLQDNTGTTPLVLSTTISTAVVTLDLRDNRVGVGKMHENGALDVAGEIYSDGVLVPTVDDLPVPATETVAGLVERATAAEVAAGTDTTRYVSPFGLAAVGPRRFRGTAAERAAKTATFGDLWQDTDGSPFMWKGASDGTWRRYSGRNTVSAGTWSYTSGTTLAARSVTWTLPTVLEDNETVLITAGDVGTGFGAFALSSVTKNPTNTTAIVRQTQIGSTATNGGSIHWQIMDL